MGKLIILLVLAQFTNGPYTQPISSSNPGWLLSTFEADQGSSPVGDIRILQSFVDASSFIYTPSLPVYNCSGHVRDPSVINYGGTYLLAHTGSGGSCQADNSTIGFSSFTRNSNGTLNSFTNELEYNCGGSPTTDDCWAPEWFADPNNCTYSSSGTGWSCSSLSNLHIFLAYSPGVEGEFFVYEMHPTASDFITNASSWSSLVQLTINNSSSSPETDIIDPYMTYGMVSDDYCIWWKNNSTGFANYGCSSTINGTFTAANADGTDWLGLSTQIGSTATEEGPCVILVNGNWRVYIDNDGDSFSAGQLWWCDFATVGTSACSTSWKPILTPTQAKQGTVIKYP